MGGDRRVSRQERSRWRFTFQRLVAEAQRALLSPDGTIAEGAALAEHIDLANDTRGYDYFHSEDPVEAARFVVSDAVTVLWWRLLEEHGFAGFAERAAPQLIRWESRFGWTRTGFCALREKECSLGSVLTGMLRSPDMWIGFADSDDAARPKQSWPGPDRVPDGRTEALSEWHGLLLAKLKDYGFEDRLDRLSKHPVPNLRDARRSAKWVRLDEAILRRKVSGGASIRDYLREAIEPGGRGCRGCRGGRHALATRRHRARPQRKGCGRPRQEDLRRDHRCIVPTLPLGSHRHPMRRDADLSLYGFGQMVAEILEPWTCATSRCCKTIMPARWCSRTRTLIASRGS